MALFGHLRGWHISSLDCPYNTLVFISDVHCYLIPRILYVESFKDILIILDLFMRYIYPCENGINYIKNAKVYEFFIFFIS